MRYFFKGLTVTIILAYFYSSFEFTIYTNVFCLGTDDDQRVVLKSISDGMDCEHDYINATYIDVRALKILEIQYNTMCYLIT